MSMTDPPILHYITDRKAFPGDESVRRVLLLDKICEAADAGVDYIQLREKDLSGRDLEFLAREAVRAIGNAATALLINSRTDIALAVKAAGVHLTSNDISPSELRTIWQCSAEFPSASSEHPSVRENSPRAPIISVSCHSPEEVHQGASSGANFALFAPVFQKESDAEARPQGLGALSQACLAGIPVLALGGITLQNASDCMKAGAAGIAAIRLFQENKMAAIVRELKTL